MNILCPVCKKILNGSDKIYSCENSGHTAKRTAAVLTGTELSGKTFFMVSRNRKVSAVFSSRKKMHVGGEIKPAVTDITLIRQNRLCCSSYATVT